MSMTRGQNTAAGLTGEHIIITIIYYYDIRGQDDGSR